MSLLLGTARADITPPWPVPLAGFAFRAGLDPAGEVARPLRLRVLAFGGSEGLATVFVSADLIWWGSSLAAVVRARIAERHGVPLAAVFLHATHTHSGPQTADGLTPLLGEVDRGYLDHLAKVTLDAVDRAAGALTPVTAERARGECDIGINRRGRPHTGPRLRPDPARPVDREVTIVRFRERSGRSKALLVHFACHPVIAGGNAVSSDFAGAAMDLLEGDLPPDAVAAYAQGCCGDVNPALLDGGWFTTGGEPEVDSFADRLAAAVWRGSAAGFVPVGSPRLTAVETSVPLRLRTAPSLRELESQHDAPGVVGEWARLLLASAGRPPSTVELRLTSMRIADDLVLLGFGAEPTTAYGQYVKRAFAGRVLPLGYTNGMFGYLVTAAEAAEGGYEAIDAPRYFGMSAPLSPTAEAHARDAVHRLVGTCFAATPEAVG